MKLFILIFAIASTASLSAQAATCTCSGTFQNPDWGTLSGSVSVSCPDSEGMTSYSCDGHMYPGQITVTCSNNQNGQSNSSSTSVNGQPDSPFPSCYVN